MTDKEFLLDVLADGQPWTLNEILRRSFDIRGCGLTVHSRISDLRKDGHTIAWWQQPGQKRGNSSVYQLVSLEGAAAEDCGAGVPGAASSAVAVPSSEADRDSPHSLAPFAGDGPPAGQLPGEATARENGTAGARGWVPPSPAPRQLTSWEAA